MGKDNEMARGRSDGSECTEREQRFVDAVFTGTSHTQAALQAGYSPKSARTLAARMLRKVHIQAALQKLKDAAAERNNVAVDKVLQEAWRVGRARISNVLTWGDGGVRIKPREQIDDDTLAAIEAISEETTRDKWGNVTRTVRVKMHHKVAAPATILKVLAPTKKQLEITGADGEPFQPLTLAEVHALIEERERIGLYFAEHNEPPPPLA